MKMDNILGRKLHIHKVVILLFVLLTVGCDYVDNKIDTKEAGMNQKCLVSNPISVTTGNKYQKEIIFESTINPYLKIYYSYNSIIENWHPTFSQKIEGSRLQTTIKLYRPDGNTYIFQKNGNEVWMPDPDVSMKLNSVRMNNEWKWRLMLKNGVIETYDSDGFLNLISQFGTNYVSFKADPSNNDKVVIKDELSNLIYSIIIDANKKLSKIIDSSGGEYRFAYTQNKMLQFISYPDGTSDTGNNPFSEDNPYREYHYENATSGKLLTGITDERGNRYATWAYDDQGRAISSEHANTTEKASLDYTYQNDEADPRVTVTNALGKQTTYHFEAIHGVRKVTKVEGHQSANCAAANQETTYDANGFVASQTDWKGNLTTYINNDRGLETSRTVASGTPEAQTITTLWHDDFNQPVSIKEPTRTTTFTYDDQGQRLTATISE